MIRQDAVDKTLLYGVGRLLNTSTKGNFIVDTKQERLSIRGVHYVAGEIFKNEKKQSLWRRADMVLSATNRQVLQHQPLAWYLSAS